MKDITKKVYKLEGLDCSYCSAKIENELNNLEGIDASVNFASSKLTVKSDINSKKNKVEFLKDMVSKIEPGVSINEFQKNETIKSNKKYIIYELIAIIFSVIFLLIGYLVEIDIFFNLGIFSLAYLIASYRVLKKAFFNILKFDFMDENFLMIIASIGAFVIGEHVEAVVVMLFFRVGELLESMAVNRSRKSIKSLLDIKPEYANILFDNKIKKVNPENVKIGSEIIIKPGEKVPLDGVVINGNSNIDISNIKGESIPLYVKEDTEILSGSINLTSLITVRTTKSFNDSTVAKVLDLVENSENSKAKIESFITKFAKIYTPIVIALTFFVAFLIPIITRDYDFRGWIHRGLIFLVISCPCALVISVPLCYFAGIGIASKYGILVKGGNYLEALSNVENVLFDKTGTLTLGNFNIEKIITNKVDKDNLLEHAAYAEYFSNHPIGNVIVKYFDERENNKDIIKTDLLESYDELAGMGMKVNLNGKIILAGNSKLMNKYNIDFKEVKERGVVVYIAYNGIYEGALILGDKLKKDAKKVIDKLHNNKIKNVVILTGDRESVAKETAKVLKVDKVFFDLLPDEKMKILNEIKNDSIGTTVFIGDGTNDAPVLNTADIGISMGGIGTSAAIETSDIVFMTDEPSKLITSIKISEYTKSIAKQNIFIAIFIKIVVMILGVVGLANMWEAVFADVGVTLIVLLNSIRIIKKNYEMEV